MEKKIQKILEKLRGLPLAEGENQTGIPFVTAWHFTDGKVQMSKTEHPYLYIVLDGILRLYTPSGRMDYIGAVLSVQNRHAAIWEGIGIFPAERFFGAFSRIYDS